MASPLAPRWITLAGVLLAGALGCARTGAIAPAGDLAAQPAPELQLLLDPRPNADTVTWLGGDVASSVALDAETWVWIFGDTLLGTVRDDCEDPSLHYCDRNVDDDPARAMIPNSVGVVHTHHDGRLVPLTPYWREDDGRPGPIFPAVDPEAFLWPLALVQLGDHLVVLASRHTRTLGLFSQGNVLLRVENPADSPDRWRLVRREIPNMHPGGDDRTPITWMSALVAHGRWVYLFGERGVAFGSETVLARLPVSDLLSPAFVVRPEYLQHAGDTLVWTVRFDEARLYALPGLPGTSETTFVEHPTLGWYTLRIPPAEFVIRLYTADRLTGPWTDRGIVYRIPAPWSTALGPDGTTPRYAAYAAKAHPELTSGHGAAVTYNVNLLSGSMESAIEAAETEHGFYVPQVLRWEAGPATSRAIVDPSSPDAERRPDPGS